MAPAPSHRLTRWLFLRLLALVSLVAFVSYAVQIEGLVGARGLLPVGDYLELVDGYLAAQRAAGDTGGGRWRFPTLCWAAHGNPALLAMAWGGAGLSVLLFFGIAQGWLLGLLWLLYLSLMVAGQTFLGFQWDSLLLETLLCSLFVAPWSLRPRAPAREPEPSRFGVWLLRLLLFKLMFLSGVVKLLSLDDAWWELRALDVHYFTQPIPAWTSWYAHQLPSWVQHLSVLLMFGFEIVVPGFVFLPRRWRLAAIPPLALFQLLIAATGNYGFFNLLTLVLCVSLADDRALLSVPGLARWAPAGGGAASAPRPGGWRRAGRRAVAVAAGLLVLASALATVREMVRTYQGRGGGGVAGRVLAAADAVLLSWGQPLLLDRTDPFHSVNGYGLFRAMTVERPEIAVLVSADGERWQEVPFRWKPGDPARRPAFTGPHMPRLDWQMWFAALDPARARGWLFALARALLEDNRTVLGLLDTSALPAGPYRYVRFQIYDYRFTSPAEKRGTGHWWVRSSPRSLLPRPLSREDFRDPAGAP